MYSKEKTKTMFLRFAGVWLMVLLVAAGGVLGPGLSPVASHTHVAMAATPPSDSACQALWDAGEKIFTIPFHFYSAIPGSDGKTTTIEEIYINGTVYVPVQGKWIRMPLGSVDKKGMAGLAAKDAKNMTCRVVREENVNGESATVYSAHAEGPKTISDGQVWISKSKGLLLREEIDSQTPGQSGKSHMSFRLEYNNVQAPKVSEAIR